MRAQDLFELVETLFEFATVTSSQARLLALLVLADGAISATPTTRGLTTITFDL